jgi:YVTN family beta-propeller protein
VTRAPARLLALLAATLASAAQATPSQQFPSYTVGPQKDGAIVMSTGQIITPAGRLIDLASKVRAKAVAINPQPGAHTAAILLMGADAAVAIVDLVSGKLVQRFSPDGDATGSYAGISYSSDGTTLFFSQDSSNFAAASVSPATGMLDSFQRVTLRPDWSIRLNNLATAYPGGLAVSADGKLAAVLLNQNNTLAVIDLTRTPPALTRLIRVGNAPNSVMIDGTTAYVSNEGGRAARPGDFTDNSAGTAIVSDPRTDSASTGTVSVVDLRTGQITATIDVGLHPTGLALAAGRLYVANAYSDDISVIDTASRTVLRTIPVHIPIPGAYGATPTNLVAVEARLYATLYTANAIAVIDPARGVLGLIPTASAPAAIAYDPVRRQLVIADDKGIGTQAIRVKLHGVTGFNSRADSGTVSLIPIPADAALPAFTQQVIENNHWDLRDNTQITGAQINPHAAPVAIPAHLGEPSLIKHVFLIIKENRTYDQILGDVAAGHGDASLAVFGHVTPNQHALAARFPLLDNVYAPSRQSADGHPWIVSGIAPYADEIQSPDWIRSYPGGNSNDEMVYTPRGFLWDAATDAHLTVRLYGEWSGTQKIDGKHSWADWYAYAQYLEGTLPKPPNNLTAGTVTETSTVPSVRKLLDPHYPSFNTGIPDQYRVDYWRAAFNRDESAGTLPAFSIIWLPDDHTTGYTRGFPTPEAAQADNDLALGRIVEAISKSHDWPSSAIFVEEDDAQNGVDHIDGHRQPVYVISPYARQNAPADHTFYTAASIDRTIEQILALRPMTQFDLVASPMRTAFTNTPNLAPFTHAAPTLPLATFPPPGDLHKPKTLKAAWAQASETLFRDKTTQVDSVDEVMLNHIIWYTSTNFTKPYPGETELRWPDAFKPGAGDND